VIWLRIHSASGFWFVDGFQNEKSLLDQSRYKSRSISSFEANVRISPNQIHGRQCPRSGGFQQKGPAILTLEVPPSLDMYLPTVD